MPERVGVPIRVEQAATTAPIVGVYAAWGQADGKSVQAGLKFDGTTLPVGMTAEGLQAFDANGNEVWLKYKLSRTSFNTVAFNVELPANHPFTIPGGPWARGSQIVLPGTLTADCTTNPVFTAKITSGPPPNGELESLWHEIGWLDLSAFFCGVDGDKTWHKGQFYPTQPGMQEEAGDRIIVRYGELEIFESPSGAKCAVFSAVRVIYPHRGYDMRLAAVVYDLGCGSCR